MAQGFFASLIASGLPCQLSGNRMTNSVDTDIIIALFGFYLTPKAVGNAELTIGSIDETKFRGMHKSV